MRENDVEYVEFRVMIPKYKISLPKSFTITPEYLQQQALLQLKEENEELLNLLKDILKKCKASPLGYNQITLYLTEDLKEQVKYTLKEIAKSRYGDPNE